MARDQLSKCSVHRVWIKPERARGAPSPLFPLYNWILIRKKRESARCCTAPYDRDVRDIWSGLHIM